MNNVWNEDLLDSGLYEKIITPIAEKALAKYGDKVLKLGFCESIKCDIDGYKVELINNPVIHEPLFSLMWPDFSDSECQCNVQIEPPHLKDRIYVSIHHFIKGKWITEKEKKNGKQ